MFGGVSGRGAPGLDGAVQLVSQSIMTVAQLLSNYPAGASYLGRYARVSDLYGTSDEIMRCCVSAGQYYWRPQRTDFAGPSVTTTGGSMTLTPLVSPPQMRVVGTLLGALTITPSTTNVWPGCQFEITMNGTLGLFLATVTGLLGGNQLIAAGSTRRIIYGMDGFYTQ